MAYLKNRNPDNASEAINNIINNVSEPFFDDLKEDLRIQLNSKKRELTSAYVRIKSLINSGGNNTQEVVASNGNNRSNLLNAKGQIGKLVKLNYEYIDRIEHHFFLLSDKHLIERYGYYLPWTIYLLK